MDYDIGMAWSGIKQQS